MMLTLENKAIKILLIGYSDAGKTYFLGSLPSLKLNNNDRSDVFSVRDKNPNITDGIQDYYEIINGTKEGSIPTTFGKRDIDLVFQHGLVDRFDITITDIEGQTVQAKEANEEDKIKRGKELHDSIKKGDFDGVFILMKSPETQINKNDTIFNGYKAQLTRILNFITDLINHDLETPIPIALLFTQIDALYEMDGITEQVEKLAKIEFQKVNTPDLPEDQKIERLEAIKGDILNDKISELVGLKSPIYLLTKYFIAQTNRPAVFENITVSKPFLCTSLGFDNSKDNPIDTTDKKTKIAKKTMSPYGVKVAFLWMIFKIIQLKKLSKDRGLFKNYWPENFNETTIENEIHSLYFDNECFSDQKSILGEIWGNKNL